MATREEVSSSADLDTNSSYHAPADGSLACLLPLGFDAQEVSRSDNTGAHTSHQALADEAFAYFLPLNYGVDSTSGLPPALPPALPATGLSAPGQNSSVTPAPYTDPYASVSPPLRTTLASGPQLPAQLTAQQLLPAAPVQQFIPAAPNQPLISPASTYQHIPPAPAPHLPPPAFPLPSLLQYTDTLLMHTTPLHNSPPDHIRTCASCRLVWDNAKITSTFLPLAPCGHWIHYRCLIWLATRDDNHHNKCPTCKTVLFEVDGVGALTLAARTRVPMGDRGLRLGLGGDEEAYEEACGVIEAVIRERFFEELGRESGFGDGSPDLVRCFEGVVEEVGRPGARWLRWSTRTGRLLFCLLVAVKMRRYLMEEQRGIVGTEAWAAWEEGWRRLQRRVLKDVRRGGGGCRGGC